MRLKPAGILITVTVIVILGYFALKPKATSVTQEQERTELPAPNSDSVGNSPMPVEPAPTEVASTSQDREFSYTPEKPVNGKLRGVVELGATGFNSFVINLDDQRRWD